MTVVLLCIEVWAGIYGLGVCRIVYALLAFRVFIKKSHIFLIGLPSYVTQSFFIAAFNTLSLFWTFNVVTTMCHGKSPFWSCLFSWVFLSWYITSFCRLRKFSLCSWKYFLCLWPSFLYSYYSYIWFLHSLPDFVNVLCQESFVFIFRILLTWCIHFFSIMSSVYEVLSYLLRFCWKWLPLWFLCKLLSFSFTLYLSLGFCIDSIS